ncbi:MAG: hypothetical protein ACM3PQ_00085 [Methanosarcina sp.]
MPRLWKVLTGLSLVLNAVCLLYLYALSHPNPYGTQYYETEQMKLELRQMKEDMATLQSEIARKEK